MLPSNRSRKRRVYLPMVMPVGHHGSGYESPVLKVITLVLLTIFLLLICTTSVLAQPAGTVVFTLGKVYKSADGKRQGLHKGDLILSGDLIETDRNSQVQIRFSDNGFLSVRPSSHLLIEDFHFENKVKQDRSSMILIKGGFRAVTGKIGARDHDSYRVTTPLATIGIRGTDYSVMMCDSCADGGTDHKNGLYVGVAIGGVHVENSGGGLDLDRNQYGYIADRNLKPVRISQPPKFLMFDHTASEKQSGKKKNITNQGLATSSQEKKPSSVESVDGDDVEVLTEVQGAGSFFESAVGGIRFVDEAGTLIVSSDESGVESVSPELITDLPVVASNDLPLSDESVLVVDAQQSEVAQQDVSIVEENVAEESVEPVLESIPQPSPEPVSELVAESTPEPTSDLVSDPIPEVTPDPDAAIGDAEQDDLEKNNRARLLAVVASHSNEKKWKKDSLGVIDQTISTAQMLQFISQEGQFELGRDSSSGLSWGRWQRDEDEDFRGSDKHRLSIDEADDVQWIMARQNEQIRSLPTTGLAVYELLAATNPSDNHGNVGVLGEARLDVDFTNRSVDTRIELDINNQSWRAQGNGLELRISGDFSGDMQVDIQHSHEHSMGAGQVAGFLVSQKKDLETPNNAAMVFQMERHGSDPTRVTGAAVMRLVE